MRCPKCSYVSFDYNLSCPKCGKDISTEQAKLNLPAFKPNPLSLLGILSGQTGGSGAELSTADSTPVGFTREAVESFEDSTGLDGGRLSVESAEELDLSLEADDGKPAKDTGEFELDTDATTAKDTGEFELDTGDKSLPDLDLGGSSSEELSLESDSLTLEQGSVDPEAILGVPQETAAVENQEGNEIDLDSLELTPEQGAEEKGEIELKLDDLKINDTGDLEVGQKDAAPRKQDQPVGIDEISLDEIPLSEELLLEDSAKEGAKRGEAEAASGVSGDEGDAIDLDDLNLDIEVDEEAKQP
jgi:hypothetical protein